ncbi:MAG: L,D-transpeptidase [Gammaproteobacteria bacterium]
MSALISAVIIAVLLAFSSISAYAKGFGASLCHHQGYQCYVTKRGDSWEKLFPDEEKRDLVMRINRMNTDLYSGLKIAIPTSEDGNPMDYSPFPKTIDPPGEKTIFVSIHNLAFGAYDSDGTLLYWGPISSAKGYCPDIGHGCHTPTGKFKIQYKEDESCVSTKFPVGRGGAPMPYCMYFHGGFALHGSYEVPGYNDSHGCVRMFVNDARWLNEEFTDDEPHARVVIYQ